MKKPILLVLSLVILGATLMAQSVHRTADNVQMQWTDPSAWVEGNGVLNSGDLCSIYGTITCENLILNNNRDLEVFDTLYVLGDLIANSYLPFPPTKITIHSDGLLVVLGDYSGRNSFLEVTGDLVVVGNLQLINYNISPIINEGNIYQIADNEDYITEDGNYIICHVPDGNPNNTQTIEISPDDWPAHEAHGDFLGPCYSRVISPSVNGYPLKSEEDLPTGLYNIIELLDCQQNDTEAPIINLPPIAAIECSDGLPEVYANFGILTASGGSVSDNCKLDPASFTHVSDSSNGESCPEIITRTYSIEDAVGNIGTASQRIIIEDTTPPNATNPDSITVQSITDIPEADVNVVTDEADNCTDAPVVSLFSEIKNGGNGSISDPFILTRTYRVSDDCGNYTDVTHILIAIDDVAPTITAPDNITVTVDEDNCEATGIDLGTPVTSDNSGVFSIENDAPLSFKIGTTLVTWTVYDVAGNSASAVQEVIVSDLIEPKIICPENVTICASDNRGTMISDIAPIDFSDNCSSGILSITYTISGATNGAGTDDASGTFFNNGASTLTYSIADESGNESTCSTDIIVNELPVTAAVSGTENPVCNAAGETYTVNGADDSKYIWTIPEQAEIITDTTPNGVNSIEVNFGPISGTISVFEISSAGCLGEVQSLDISLVGCDLIAEFVSDKENSCAGDTVIFESVSSGVTRNSTYSWNFGENAEPSTAIGSGPYAVYYTDPGNKVVSLTITDGITESVSHTITVAAVPEVNLFSTDRCGSGSILFNAESDLGNQVYFSINKGQTVAYCDSSAPFEYSISLDEEESATVWAMAIDTTTGCAGRWSDGLTKRAYQIPVTSPINFETPGTSYDEEVCRGDEKKYSVESVAGVSHIWSVPALALEVTDTDEITVDWDIDQGLYRIEVQSVQENGCAANPRNASILVSDPYFELGPNRQICEGEEFTIEAIGNWVSYHWHNGSEAPSYTTSETENISVAVTNQYGCQKSDSMKLVAHENPEFDLGGNITLCENEPYTLSVDGYETYLWSTGDNGNSIELYPGAQTIWLQVADENDCNASDTLVVNACDSDELFNSITNTFTPNNDGVHDTWIIDGIENYTRVKLVVFDRVGRIVYQSEGGYENDWDGSLNGYPLPMDTYYYLIDFNSDHIKPRSGSITIVR